jgi:hypothetical protein
LPNDNDLSGRNFRAAGGDDNGVPVPDLGVSRQLLATGDDDGPRLDAFEAFDSNIESRVVLT